MLGVRRKISIVLAFFLLFIVFLYVEHPLVRPLKTAFATIGFIDSERVLVGITDIRSIDHVRGDRDASVVLIDYSDFGCVLCAAMQDNFDRIVKEEGVATVSRHLYLDMTGQSFHNAVAAECVAKHVGEEAYFTFSRYLYDNQHLSARTNSEHITQQAISLGINAQEFQDCITNDTVIRRKILHDSEEGRRLGAVGTPYIIVTYNGRPIGISYANEYSRFLERVRLLVQRAQLNESV